MEGDNVRMGEEGLVDGYFDIGGTKGRDGRNDGGWTKGQWRPGEPEVRGLVGRRRNGDAVLHQCKTLVKVEASESPQNGTRLQFQGDEAGGSPM